MLFEMVNRCRITVCCVRFRAEGRTLLLPTVAFGCVGGVPQNSHTMPLRTRVTTLSRMSTHALSEILMPWPNLPMQLSTLLAEI